MRNGGRVVDESGRGTRLVRSTPLCSGRTPLSPRANTSVNGANTPVTPPSSNGRYTGSPIRRRLRSVTECARLSSSTPKTKTGKREAANSGARVRGSGGGSRKKRIRSKARALHRTVRLQTQVEERLAEEEFDVQQTVCRAKAIAIDLPVWIHQGRFHGHLEWGAEGVIESFVADLRRIRHGFDGVLFVGYDRKDIVTLIKDREQAERTRAAGESGVVFDRRSKTPIMPSDFNSWLRRSRKAARGGIADALVTISLAENEVTWTGPSRRKGITAFYGVEAGDEPGATSGGGMDPDGSAAEGTGAPADASQVPLLHIRKGAAADSDVQRTRGPDIGEAEPSIVHFIVWSEEYFGENITEWLVYSVDTDQWMIVLLAMGTGFLKATGSGHVKVTVEKRVGPQSTYVYVNRVFEAIRDQRDGSESAWPAASFQGWSPDENEKARLFVLAYLLAGCDFLPAISGLGFDRMWACALKSIRAGGIFDSSIFVQDNGVWNVDIEGCVKLLATIFYFKYESSFKDVCESPGELLRNLNGKVDEYVKCIWFVILKFGTARATSVCPPYESMRLQCLRANAMLGYWQDGCKKTMPPRDFKDQGLGVDPTLKNFASLDLTKENCVMWLSEHSCVGSDNKTKTLACKDCRPPTNGRPINCQRCRCHKDGRKCSLSCGCRGTCNERRFAKPAAASPAQPAAVPARPTAPPTPAAASNAPPIHNTVTGPRAP